MKLLSCSGNDFRAAEGMQQFIWGAPSLQSDRQRLHATKDAEGFEKLRCSSSAQWGRLTMSRLSSALFPTLNRASVGVGGTICSPSQHFCRLTCRADKSGFEMWSFSYVSSSGRNKKNIYASWNQQVTHAEIFSIIPWKNAHSKKSKSPSPNSCYFKS